MQKSIRNSNFEFLRIISMYMIVFIHANMYLGHFCQGMTRVFFNGVVNGICNIGVTCFILISGYFGLNFNIRKLMKMECMMIAFSFIETIILCLVMPEEMQGAALLEQIIKSCCPVITRKYWFYSSYICLYCLSGYIDKFIDSLKKDEYKKLLGILLLFFSVFPTLFYFEIIPDNGKGLFQMIIIYLLGRYIRKYGIVTISKGKSAILFLGLWILNGISHEIPIQLGGIYHHWCKDNSITNVIMAVILVSLVKNWEMQSNIVNNISKHIFAVFALNNSLVLAVMHCITNSGKIHTSGVEGFLLLTGIVACIMLLCFLIGNIRELTMGKMEEKIIAKILQIRWTKSEESGY